MREIFEVMPQRLQIPLKKAFEAFGRQITEIRIKKACPLIVVINGRCEFLSPSGASSRAENAVFVFDGDVDDVFAAVCKYSVYTYEDEIKNGFVTMQGGHRVGLVGTCVQKNEKIYSLKNITGLNIRVAREVVGCAESIIDKIFAENRVKNTIILSAPGCGKTTLLRDIARSLSLKKIKVAVIDERTEICACGEGGSPFDMGYCVDVLSEFPKADGVFRALRTLSPEVIMMDEIGSSRELDGIIAGMNSGVSFILTAHAKNIAELKKRGMLFEGAELLVVLSGVGNIDEVVEVNGDENSGSCNNLGSVRLYGLL